jgi:hypothetical protein
VLTVTRVGAITPVPHGPIGTSHVCAEGGVYDHEDGLADLGGMRSRVGVLG